jgi:hypothetical protein
LFLVLVISGVSSYFYSNQVSYPVQTPVTQYIPEQRSRYVSVYHVDVAQTLSNNIPLSYTWDANSRPFDTIAFSFLETSQPLALLIYGNKYGVVYNNVTNNQGLHYIGVRSDDTYKFQIFNSPTPDIPVFIQGSIDVFHTEYYTEQVPYTSYETTYQTYTDYPYRSFGGLLLLLGVVAGIGTGISLLINRRRMREIL